MENASKALLMAGGILITLIIISALLLMFNQLGIFQNAQSNSAMASQLAEFNFDFERYADDQGIAGTDLISLANKIVDYNTKANRGGYSKNIDYDIKMTLKVDMRGFKQKYGYRQGDNVLFKLLEYTISDEADAQGRRNVNYLKEIIDDYNTQDAALLKKLASVYVESDERGSIEKMYELLLEYNREQYTGWNVRYTTHEPTLNQIKNYKEYTEFKTSKFVASRDPEYQNGQIKTLYFKFVE